MAAAIPAFASEFLSGEMGPFWPHFTLLSLSVLASIAVGIGIIFERPKYSESVHKAAFWLIVVGIAVEALCTIFLFVFDEGISGAQQNTIIALEERLAPRTISATQRVRLIAALKPYANVKFDAATAISDNEQVAFLQAVLRVLADAGWQQIPWTYSKGGIGYTLSAPRAVQVGTVATSDVQIDVTKESFDATRAPAQALILALRSIGIAVFGAAVPAAELNNANPQAIHLMVGQKR